MLGFPFLSLFGMVGDYPKPVVRTFNLDINKLYITSTSKQAHPVVVSFLSASGQEGISQPSV